MFETPLFIYPFTQQIFIEHVPWLRMGERNGKRKGRANLHGYVYKVSVKIGFKLLPGFVRSATDRMMSKNRCSSRTQGCYNEVGEAVIT